MGKAVSECQTIHAMGNEFDIAIYRFSFREL